MSIKKTYRSLNETYDFGNYTEQVKNCISLFDGVYSYDCPESQTAAGFVECAAFKSTINTAIENSVSQIACANNIEDCERISTFKMTLFRNHHDHNIFQIRMMTSSFNRSYYFLFDIFYNNRNGDQFGRSSLAQESFYPFYRLAYDMQHIKL